MTGQSKKRFSLLLIGMFFAFYCFSQTDSLDEKELPDHTLTAAPPALEEDFYKGSAQGGGGLVFPFSNKALRLSLQGVYYVHGSANYVLIPHLYAGLELENVQFGSSPVAAYNTNMFIYNVGLKIGYYTYMKNDFLLCYSVSIGPSLIKYTGALISPPKGGFNQQSFFTTPNVFAGYRVNNELRIGFDISYVFMGYRFNPAYIGISQAIENYNPSYANAITSYFAIGFGVYYAFAETK